MQTNHRVHHRCQNNQDDNDDNQHSRNSNNCYKKNSGNAHNGKNKSLDNENNGCDNANQTIQQKRNMSHSIRNTPCALFIARNFFIK